MASQLGLDRLGVTMAQSEKARFEGFADSDAKFFRSLAKNNERDWFLAHKGDFEEGWNAPMKLLLSEVRDAIDARYAHCDLDEPKVFRIFRDVRFSKDKAPYKTHIGGYIPLKRGGKKSTDLPMALYFHVGATERFGAAGYYMMEPESLERFRGAVADDKRGNDLDKILGALDRKGFPAHAHERLKRVPKGYDPEHPRAEMLKSKGLVVRFPAVPAGLLATPKLVKWVADGCKAAAPLVEWLVFATA
jgi:uncharacterized protein (TIGR02453 family)